MKEMEDSDIVARSYLTVFFMDINNLKDALTGYRSIILRLQIKTRENMIEKLETLDDEMKNAVIQWSDSVRHNVERCQIAAIAIKEIIPDMDITTLETNYSLIINQFSPNIEDVSKYTFEINKLFVKGTIEKLLTKMDRFYEQYTNE